MAIERAAGGASLIDVLERILDKGIVIDAWAQVSLLSVGLLNEGTSVVVVHGPPAGASSSCVSESSAAAASAPRSL
jgi:hypothetical protein